MNKIQEYADKLQRIFDDGRYISTLGVWQWHHIEIIAIETAKYEIKITFRKNTLKPPTKSLQLFHLREICQIINSQVFGNSELPEHEMSGRANGCANYCILKFPIEN